MYEIGTAVDIGDVLSLKNRIQSEGRHIDGPYRPTHPHHPLNKSIHPIVQKSNKQILLG